MSVKLRINLKRADRGKWLSDPGGQTAGLLFYATGIELCGKLWRSSFQRNVMFLLMADPPNLKRLFLALPSYFCKGLLEELILKV